MEQSIQQKNQKVILFADISGSSALYKTLGNQRAKTIIDSLLNKLKTIVLAHQGQVIKTIGDEIMTSFSEMNQSLNAATDMQQKFNSLLPSSQLKLSIGIGYGAVLIEKNDLFGEAVNDAAYLTNLAKGGQILLSQSAFAQLPHLNFNVREFDRVKIKGADTHSLVYRVYWQDEKSKQSETQLMSSEVIEDALALYQLKIKYAENQITISVINTPFVIGRDRELCDLVVEGSQVSREHCEIVFSRGKFVLVDHSTNGCYLSTSGNAEFYLRREEYPIIEPICLSLGLPAEQAKENIIQLLF